MAKVEYNRDNFNRCLCGGCPVNRNSACVRKQEGIEGQVEKIEHEGIMPSPNRMPGIYCAHGKSLCNDLNNKKSCLCPSCPVAITSCLKNSYYCLKGSAEEVG